MNQSETLYQELTRLKRLHIGESWLSEGDSPITVKKLAWYNLFRKKRMPDGEEIQYLDSAVETAEGILATYADVAKPSADDRRLISSQKGVVALCKLMLKQERLIGLRKLIGPSKYRITILANFGPWAYVGIQFTTAET